MNNRCLLSAFLISILICDPIFVGAVRFGTAQDSGEYFSVSGLEAIIDGQALFTTEKTHTSSYSAKLVIPKDAERGSCAFALYHYNKPLSSILTVSVFVSFKNAVPVFIFRLDTNGDAVAEISLMHR